MKSVSAFLFSAMLVMSISCVYGQDNSNSDRFVAAKIYSYSAIDFDKSNQNFVDLLYTFSPSISWGREYGDFQEVEAGDFNLSFTNQSTDISAGAEYSYNWKLNDRARGLNGSGSNSKFNFYVGAGVRTQIDYRKTIDENPYITSYTSNSINLNLVLIPRMTIDLSKRVKLDVSLPYNYYNYSSSFYEINGSSDSRPNTESTNSTTFPNKFTVKVGVAFKF